MNVALLGMGYRVIEVADLLPGSGGYKFSYARVDVGQCIIWLYSGVPVHLRESILYEARLKASMVHHIRLGAVR